MKNERLERLDADKRFLRIWALGGILHDASRDIRIAAKLRSGGALLEALPALKPKERANG